MTKLPARVLGAVNEFDANGNLLAPLSPVAAG